MVTGNEAPFPDGTKNRHFSPTPFITIGTAGMEDTARRYIEGTGDFT